MYIFEDIDKLGKFLVLFTVIIYITPGQRLFQVIRTLNYKLIPIWTSVIGLIASFGWVVFGAVKRDVNCLVPNGIGFAFSVLNTFVWLYAYLKSKSNNNNNKYDEIDERNDTMLKDI